MNNVRRTPDLPLRAMALLGIAFGVLTIKEGGMTLGGNAAAVAAAGNFAPFVLWFNFLAGFAYVVAGAGLWMQRRWAAWLAAAIAAATALVFSAFGVLVAFGTAYEQRTLIAMTLRLLLWTAIAAFAWWRLVRESEMKQ
jgi:hypothetical protein